LLFLSLCSSGFQDLPRLNPPSLLMEPIEGSETSAIRTKTPGNYPKENILRIEDSEGLKLRRVKLPKHEAVHSPPNADVNSVLSVRSSRHVT
jgi:hypothetical protein